MHLIRNYNKGMRFYYVLLMFLANMHVLFLQNIRKVFQFQCFLRDLDKSRRKPNKRRVEKGSKFYNSSIRS